MAETLSTAEYKAAWQMGYRDGRYGLDDASHILIPEARDDYQMGRRAGEALR